MSRPPRFDDERFVTSGVGTPMWAGRVGEGPAIVLCDGLGCDGYVWKHILADLRRDHTVVRLHYRGHGRSAVPRDLADMSVAGLAEDIFRVLDAYEIETAMVAGHSMGVQVILEAALGAQADRLRAVIALCGAPGRPLDTFKNTSLSMRIFPKIRALAHRHPDTFRQIWRRMVPSEAALTMANWFEINSALVHVEELRPYLEELSTMDPLAFLAMLNDASQHTTEDRLGSLDLPTLVVAAEHDTFTPMHRSVTMAEAIADAELFVLPRATHTGPLEWPELLNLRIRRFLRDRGLLTACLPPRNPGDSV